jgi:hypothetical protein
MTMRIACITLAVLTFCLGERDVLAGGLADLPMGKEPISLLEGRATVTAPAGAKVEARAHSIMAAPQSNESETRVVLEANQAKLVLMAVEMFQTAGADFGQRVAKEANTLAAEVETRFAVEPLGSAVPSEANAATGFIITPENLKGTGDAIPLQTAFVVLPDKTILNLTVFANPEAYKNRDDCLRVSRAILKSVRAGGRPMRAQAGLRRLHVYSEDKELALTLPEGFVLTTQRGPDFLVHHLRSVCPFGDRPQALSLYYGGHPAYMHDRRGNQDANVPQEKGKLLGQEVLWYNWVSRDGNESTYSSEVMIKGAVPKEEYPMIVHMFMNAGDEKQLAALRQIAGTLSVVDAAKQPASASAPTRREVKPKGGE